MIGLEHLNKAVKIEPDFQLGLYRLADFNNYGIGMEINLEQSMIYWERLIDTKGYYRLLALDAAAKIYFYEFNEINKAKKYLTVCAKEGGAKCLFELNHWKNKLKFRPYILEAKNRERSADSN
ncbi:hypothetical protein [Providencia sp. Me31A]|uniref:hypothetical protein n=1 Tax=Providencia sp. Me31A TaxID=3392637 RepID=UPI003D2E9B46